MSDACCGGLEHAAGAPGRVRDIREVRAAALAGLALSSGLAAGWAGATTLSDGLLATAAIAGGSGFVPQAARSMLKGRLGVGTLMAVAALGAAALGDLAEAATLCFLFSISEALEGYALARTRHGLRALLDLVPAQATVLVEGAAHVVPAAELRPGDRLLVRPGDRVATDGVVRAGRSSLDCSAVTGESLPVEVGPGDQVFAATINGGAALEVEVTAATEQNSLARVVAIVEEAQERKGRSQRLAERIARPLVPAVLVVAGALALASAAAGQGRLGLGRALVVLVAAAPCAFAISVPVTVVAAIGAATRAGVLIKGGGALEALARVRTVALDKTGTLTRGSPRVVAVACSPGARRADVLAAAAALEARSEHPLARAVLAAAGPPLPAEDVEAVPGRGLVGRIGPDVVRLGRPGFVPLATLEAEAARLQGEGATVVGVEIAGRVLGLVAVRDDLRPEAAATVAELHGAGMATAMLTGDNRATAEALAREAGVGEAHSELLPSGKVAVVERLEASAPVAMVGDGINDAPALASATVGIAMGALGADVAIEAADVALMGDDLGHLPDVFAHARRARRIMLQNLALSGAILVVLVPLAAVGAMGLAAVVATHELAEVVVIANGVRAGRRTAFVHSQALARAAPPAAAEPVAGACPGCRDGSCGDQCASAASSTRAGTA